MAAFDDTCFVCGRRFRNSTVEMLRYCSVGCWSRALAGDLEVSPEEMERMVSETKAMIERLDTERTARLQPRETADPTDD